jgi:hypothetical protein
MFGKSFKFWLLFTNFMKQLFISHNGNQVFQSQIHFHKLIKHKKSRFSFIEDLQLKLLVEKYAEKNGISFLLWRPIEIQSNAKRDRKDFFLQMLTSAFGQKKKILYWLKNEKNLVLIGWKFSSFPKRTDIALENRWNFLQRKKQENG